jgi:hypothetical protein
VGLRLFVISFMTGVCAVLLILVAASILLDSDDSAADASGQVPATEISQGQTIQAVATPAPTTSAQPLVLDPTSPPAPTATLEPTATSAPTETPQPTATPTPELPPAPAVPTAPLPPAGLTASLNGGAVVLTWNAVPGAGYYNIYRSQVPGGGPGATYVAIGSSGAPTVQDSTVQSGQTYYYVVTSSAAGLESDSSNEAAISIP